MIYPVNQQIEAILESFIDPETGELIPEVSEETMEEAIGKIEMEFQEKMEALVYKYKNLKAEEAAIKAEKDKLAKRQKSTAAERERTGRFLAWLTEGQPYRNGAVNIGYRASESTDIEPGFVEWALENKPELLRKKEVYEPDSAKVKEWLLAGNESDLARISRKNNIQVK